jgi:hypothetical protein
MEPTNGYISDLTDLSDPLSVKLQSLRRREMQPLRETGQGPGTAIGFFEQGIIVGALFIVLPVVSLVGYLGWMLARRLLLGTTGETFAI